MASQTPISQVKREAGAARTRPRGSASGGMGPKWSPGTVTMMRPDAALARPARTARSVVNASSGRSLSLMRCGGASGQCQLRGRPSVFFFMSIVP